jgi:hypothetical protein
VTMGLLNLAAAIDASRSGDIGAFRPAAHIP